MTIRRSIATALLLVLPLLAPSTARAQSSPIGFGFGGGVATPIGSFGDDADAGWRALGTLAISVPLVPVGLRVDAAYDHFNVNQTLVGGVGVSGSQRVASLSVNPTFRLPTPPLLPLSSYLIGGIGAYNVSCGGDLSCDSSTRFGWNAGLGLKLRAVVITAFAEARFHYVNLDGGSMKYLPVTVGLLF